MTQQFDIALAVDQLLPAAEYRGSTTANTPEAWDAVVWLDERRDKPTWAELAAAAPDMEAAARLAEIDARLAGIDAESARPLRAVVSGTAEDADHAKLAALEAEAAALREERRGLA